MQFKPENFVLDESLGYLVGKLRGYMALALDEQVADLDISATQAIVLLRVAYAPGTPAATLCRFGGYDTGAMTRLLDKLEDKGLITRMRSEADRRVIELNLTQAGHDLCGRLPERFCRVGNVLMEEFSEEDVAALKRLLRRALDKAEQEWGSIAANFPDAKEGNAS